MKKLFIIIAAIGFLYSCGGNTQKNQEEDKASVSEFSDIAKQVSGDEHNAKNSLDYKGVYSGTTPAADCPGIKVVITLSDSTYTKTMEYIDRAGKATEEKGKYVWNEKGNTITLEGASAPNQYFVGENTLTQLDMEGNKITGDLAEKYILKK